MKQGPSIVLNNTAVTVNNNPLLKPVSCQLAGSQWHAIAGPNGGGKSTLLKAIAGLHSHQGDIEIHWAGSKGRVGYMPQLSPFDSSLPVTALDFLRMHQPSNPIWKRYKQNSVIENVIEKVSIAHLTEKRLGTLSTGERQRILMACALINDPQLLLLDEPMAGVDADGRDLLIEIIRDFSQSGGTIIMIEHDWAIIQENCHSLSWIDGSLINHGNPADVLEQYKQTIVGGH